MRPPRPSRQPDTTGFPRCWRSVPFGAPHIGPYRAPDDSVRSAAGRVRDYVRVNAGGRASQCAGTRAGEAAFSAAIMSWVPSALCPIGSAVLALVGPSIRSNILEQVRGLDVHRLRLATTKWRAWTRTQLGRPDLGSPRCGNSLQHRADLPGANGSGLGGLQSISGSG